MAALEMSQEQVRMRMEGMIPGEVPPKDLELTQEQLEKLGQLAAQLGNVQEPLQAPLDGKVGSELGAPAETAGLGDLEPTLRIPGDLYPGGVTPDERLTPGEQVPPAPVNVARGTVIAQDIDTKFIEELQRIADMREACTFLVQNLVRQVEDRFVILSKAQEELWARLKKQYHLTDEYIYKLDYATRSVVVVGRFDDPAFLQPGNFQG